MNALKPSGKGRSLFLILFGIVFTVIVCALMISPLRKVLNHPQEGGIGLYLPSLLLFACVGLAITAWGILPWIAWLRVSPPEVTIDKTTVALGDNFAVNYFQNFRNRSDVRGIHLSLVMRETARYRRGKNNYVAHHEETAAEFDQPGRTYETGDTLAFSQTIDIPRNGMHTFHGMHNAIDWQLRVKVNIAGWPDYEDAFDLDVKPSQGPVRTL
jgi:hypothetical protein